MSDWLYQQLLEPLTQTYFQKALLGSSLVAIVCGVIGCFVILRRMAFLGDALAHAMLAGVSAGYLLMKLVFGYEAHAVAMLLGASISAVLTVALIGFISRVSRIKEDTVIGTMYTGVFAAGGVLVSLFAEHIHIDLLHFIMGNVLAITDGDLWVAGIVAAFVLSAVILFYRPLQLTSFDPVMAAAIGVPVVAVDYLLTACTSFVVVSGVSLVGVIQVVGMLVTPAATAYLLCDRLSRMLVLSAVFGVTSVISGLYFALWLNVAGGSSIVLMCTVQFFMVLVAAPRYGLLAGWLRRRSLVPQELWEKILRGVLKNEGHPIPPQKLAGYLQISSEDIRRGVRFLEGKGFLATLPEGLTLTELGLREARRILRAHRLWESYLQHVGMPEGEWHPRAERLQHVHDEAAVDYLDSKLGHPLRDPHGKEIPEDFEHVVPGNQVRATLLREGHLATITSVQAGAPADLLPGMQVRVGPRLQNETVWTLILPEGREVALDRAAAETVFVRVEERVEPLPSDASGSSSGDYVRHS